MKFCQLFVQIGNIIICRFFTGATHAIVMCKECPAVELWWWGGADGNQGRLCSIFEKIFKID